MVKINIRRRERGTAFSNRVDEVSRVPCADEYYADPETGLWYQVDVVVHTPGNAYEAIVYLHRYAVEEMQIVDKPQPVLPTSW